MTLPWQHPSLERYQAYLQQPATPADRGLTAHFLGTSSLLLTDGRTTLLSDGFVTRPGLAALTFGRITPDEALVDAAIERLRITTLDAVFCMHSHYDHAMDAPIWVRETGAELVGSESTANVGRGLGLPESALRVVQEKETVGYGDFELTFVHSVHHPSDEYPGTIDEPLVPPARAGRWRTGTCYSVLVAHPHGRLLIQGSANYVPGALTGYEADVVYLGIAMPGKKDERFIETYWNEVIRATKARRVIPIHWDNFMAPLHQPLRPLPYILGDISFVLDRLLDLADRDGVELRLPIAWEPTDPFAASG